jgi:TRAP-type mannitol/chloroaromatic compound transport system substrate-binding protein
LLQKNRENEMKIRRRSVLLGATGAALAAGSLPAPAIAQGIRELNMVTSWPANFFPYGISADRLAQSIGAMSDGRLKVKVFPADKLVGAFDVFDAVSAGVADMYYSATIITALKSRR